MASVQTIWGVDVGRCALKALKLRVAADNSVEIVASDYIEHPKILSQPDADRHELISAAIEKFLSHNDLSKDRVAVSVPGQHTLARFTKLPPVAPKRIPDIVRYEADQQIPFDMDDVIWDYQTFEEEDLPDLEVGIFAMKRELLREHLLHFEQAAIEPVAVQSCPLALYNAARFDGLLSEETTVLLDIGAENADLVIATPTNLWTRTIPIGGNHFTEALVKTFKLSFAKAENLKRTGESSKYRRQILQAMRPILADLVQELQRSIGFYSSTHRDAQIDKAVTTGNATKLPGLQKYLQQNLGVKVERVGGFRKVTPNAAAKDETLSEQIQSFTVAYGLALQGLELAKITSNLLPTEIAKQVVWRKKRPAFAAAAACLVLAGGVIWFRQTADMRALAGSQPGRIFLDEYNELKEELNEVLEQGQEEREAAETLVELQRNKAFVPKLLRLVHSSLPEPEGALDGAGTLDEYLKAVPNAPPRAQRKQIFFESVLVQFEDDLNAYEWMPVGEEEVPIIPPSDAELPGIKIEIECRTPNAGGPKFIREEFMDRLKANGRQAGTGYFIDRVYLIEGEKISASLDEDSGSRGGALRGGRPAGVLPGGTQSGVVSTDLNPESVDVITGESIRDDWRFLIWADVILEDYPEADEEGEAEEYEEEED
ncbi:MAG: type IV pilus assembly protein PilM [Phycisphaerales bacterium]|nr:MAG: type IV pilus assembly protein PilM [Phycisphaerales bacterium]